MVSDIKNIKVIFISILACFVWAGCSSLVCQSGEAKDAGDGCNTCVCARGAWACTAMACNLGESVFDTGNFRSPVMDNGLERDGAVDAGEVVVEAVVEVSDAGNVL